MLARWLALVVVFVALGACVGGQSGTESGGGSKVLPDPSISIWNTPGSCACALSGMPAVALRGTVVRVERESVRLRVRSLLGEGTAEPLLRFAPGDEIGGKWAEPGCDPIQGLQPGDDVAALHLPGAQSSYECPERQACSSQRCDFLRAGDPRITTCYGDCQRETQTQCAMHAGEALLAGRVLVARWSGELVLPLARGGVREGELRVAPGALPQLLDSVQCQRRIDEVLPPLEEPFADGGLDLPGDVTLGSAAGD